MRSPWSVTSLTCAALVGAGVAVIAGCPGDELTCVDADLGCQPLYPPTFENVFTNTFLPKCGTPGSSCHSAAGHRAGLVLDNRDEAYRLLLMNDRVIPGEPSCSVLIERVYAPFELRMPPGRTLSDAERCALVQWVAAGAPRTP